MTLEQVRMWLASETVTPEQADRYISVITQIERERIIKLLEDELVEFKHIPTDVHGNFRLTLDCLIALIKGENK